MTVPGGRRAGRRRLVATIGLGAAAFVVVAVAAVGGAVPLAVEGDASWSVPAREADGDGSATTALDQALLDPPESTTTDVIAVLTQVAGITAVTIVLFLAGRAILRALRMEPSGRRPVIEPAQAPPSGPRELGEAVDDGLAALTDGPVDDVIVACWVRLEEAAGAGGVARRPSETPAELTVRVLARFDVPAEPVSQLLGRYRAARYSCHVLGEDDRAAAIAALGEIRGAIGRVPA